MFSKVYVVCILAFQFLGIKKMEIAFSDLHTQTGLKSLDEFLSGKTYISGEQLSKDDIKVFTAVLGKPGEGFPNVGRWYESVSSHLAASFPGKVVGVRFVGQAAPPTKEAKKRYEAIMHIGRQIGVTFGDKNEDCYELFQFVETRGRQEQQISSPTKTHLSPKGNKELWMFTSVYGQIVVDDREEFWAKLSVARGRSDYP